MSRGVIAKRSEVPWPRASVLSSPITVAVHACTVSVPVCVPAPAVPSFPHVAARVASPSPLKSIFGRLVPRESLDTSAAYIHRPQRLRKTTTVLSAQHRLRSTALFSETVKRGRKKGSKTVVVYLYSGAAHAEATPPLPHLSESATAGPRAGVVVSKAVGNAVTRHRVSRVLRHALGEVLGLRAGSVGVSEAAPGSASDSGTAGESVFAAAADATRATQGLTPLDVPEGSTIVVRALPASAHASFEEVTRDVHSCIRRILG